jgi:bifunctional non-homologous end joining protein LigD
MLLRSARELPSGDDWAFEPKWDGFRCLAHLGEDTRLLSRRGNDLLPFVTELRRLHRGVPLPVVLDSELVAVRSGRPSFDALHGRVFGGRPPDPDTPVVLVVFDLLVLGGHQVTSLPYERRRRILEGLGIEGPGMQLTVAYPAPEGPALFAATKAQGLEGVVAKRLGSPYRPGGGPARDQGPGPLPVTHRGRPGPRSHRRGFAPLKGSAPRGGAWKATGQGPASRGRVLGSALGR